ncbi:hypothetical protein F4677DRAFT_11617 [Hypoxylon crocopeplum]|nr:hypothetical protein F4677DRAFT_11617 [Hypoxylon crocopeplum]
MAAESSTVQRSRRGSVASELSTLNFHNGVKVDLLNALESIGTSGSFAASGSISDATFADPRLEVEGVGNITLPLRTEQAQQLIAKARQAPFGKGTRTIVDTSVRNTWELDASMLKFCNPQWQSFLQQLCLTVQSQLGVKSNIKAELYKMLIYETGAMFKSHTDSIKAPGMFGTLVICLPSVHDGGEIVVKHTSRKKTFNFSGMKQAYACWYSDVSHKVLPVKSGYRWVLTYNLTLPPEIARPSAELANGETRQLRHTIRRWLVHSGDIECEDANIQASDSDSDYYFYYGLEHEYTEDEISLAAMKSVDRKRVKALSAVSGSVPVDIFLAILEKEELNEVYEDYYHRRDYYDCYEEEEEEEEEEDSDKDSDEDSDEESGPPERTGNLETTYRIKKLVDLEGNQLVSDVDMDEECVLQDDFFDDDPDDVEESGFTGNEGATETNWYRRAAVVIVRRNVAVDFILDSITKDRLGDNENIRSVVSYFAKIALDPTSRSRGLDALNDLCTCSMDGISAKTMLSTMIELEEWEMYKSFTQRLFNLRSENPIDPPFFEWVHRHIEMKPESFDKLKDGLAYVVLSNPRLKSRLSSLMDVAPPAQASLPHNIQQWARSVLRQALHDAKLKTPCEDDGKHIIECVKAYYASDDGFLCQSVIPLAESKPAESPFTISFLNELHCHMETGWPSPATTLEHWKRIASRMIAALDVCSLYCPTDPSPPKAPKAVNPYTFGSYKQGTFGSYKPPPPLKDIAKAITPGALVEFVGNLVMPGMGDDMIRDFCLKFDADTTHGISAEAFHGLWIPFLRGLVPVLEARTVPLSTPVFQQMFTAILTSYITVYVGRQPASSTNLVRPAVKCTEGDCVDCKSLNAFLRQSNQKVGRFALAERRRKHLTNQLYGIECSTSTERKGSPHTLVVTKTFANNDKERREWTSRKDKAEKLFKTFTQYKLKALLGNKYESIREFGVLQHISGPVAGAKRKAAQTEIIDLTED